MARGVPLRLVGYALKATTIRWYLTTVPRSMLGRAFTADLHAVQALTYGAMFAHVLVRSVRIQAALANEIPLEQLRPLASLHVARAFARELVDGLASSTHASWHELMLTVGNVLISLDRELKPSRSRQRIALKLGGIGA